MKNAKHNNKDDHDEVTRFLERQSKFIDKYLPDGMEFSILYAHTDGTGMVHHLSNMCPFHEAAAMRELASKLDKDIAESN